MDVLDAERGWVSLDPTHDREQTEAYVRVAVGRDYADVPPTRGVFKGTAEETLEVAVQDRRPVSARLGSELDGWRVEEYGRSHDGRAAACLPAAERTGRSPAC